VTGHPDNSSPWPRRFALWTFLAAIPLVLFGGTVTTLRAGLAESGWLRPDGYFLWLYPLEMRVRDLGTFVEHHHREFGSLVGLLAIGLVVSTWWTTSGTASGTNRRASARWLSIAALAAISLQGVVGGMRVLERNPDLAFLHGALAHGVFALLACVAVAFSNAWRHARRPAATGRTDPTRLAAFTTALVYAQIVIGAWYRHTHAPLGLALHVLLALAVVGMVTTTALALCSAAEQPAQTGTHRPDARILPRARARLIALVWIQVGLGLLAALMIFQVSGGPEGAVSAGEAVFATLHVGVGAALLAQCAASWMWARRLSPREATERALTPATAGPIGPIGMSR
jgi:heme A synthase